MSKLLQNLGTAINESLRWNEAEEVATALEQIASEMRIKIEEIKNAGQKDN